MTDWTKREWWPLAIALAWIVNPRLGLSPGIADAQTTVRIAQEVALAMVRGISYLPAELHRPGPPKLEFDAAWDKLRVAAAEDRVSLRGVLSPRGGFPVAWLDHENGATAIPAAEVQNLIVHYPADTNENCLGPDREAPDHAYPPSSGRFWRKVTVWRPELQVEFLPSTTNGAILPEQRATLVGMPGATSGLQAIVAADREAFPNGPPQGMRVSERRRRASAVLKAKGISQPSDRSFQRAGIGKVST